MAQSNATTLTIALVMMVAATVRVGAVTCYECNSVVVGMENCPEHDFASVAGNVSTKDGCKVCEKSINHVSSVMLVQRKCTGQCEVHHTDTTAARRIITCCHTDLCNQAPGLTSTITSTVMIVMIGVMSIRFYN